MNNLPFTPQTKLNFGILLVLLLGFSQVFAQPSDASILTKLKSSNNQNLISVRLIGKGEVSKQLENNTEVVKYYREYESKLKTEWDGVTRIYNAQIVYKKSGGNWVYVQKTVGNSSYEGLDNPSISKIQELAKADALGFVGNARGSDVVSELSDVKLSDKPGWYFTSPTKVEVNVYTTYTEKATGGDPRTETVEALYRITLVRASMTDSWGLGPCRHQNQKVLSTEALSKEAYNAKISLKQSGIVKRNESDLASLPDIEIPVFKNHGALVRHTLQIVAKNDPKLLEAYLRKMWSADHFDPAMKEVFTNATGARFDKLVVAMEGYSDQFCDRPLLQKSGENYTSWYNKIHNSTASIKSKDLGNGKREIVSISIGTVNVAGVNGKKMVGMKCVNYDNPLRRTRKAKLNSVIGQYVFCSYKDSEWSYVGQIDGASTSGYTIKWLDGSSSPEPAKACSNYELLEGDEVYYKNSRGENVKAWVSENKGAMSVKIKDLAGKETIIHLKDLKFK